MNINWFRAENGKIAFNKYELIVRHYQNVEKTIYLDKIYYVDEAEREEWETQQIAKHRMLELVSKTELDLSGYAWMEGIELKTEQTAAEISRIAAYGSLEAYEASLPESQDSYMLDMDYRLSKLELGI